MEVGGSGYDKIVHWCLPGLQDAWNELLFTKLFYSSLITIYIEDIQNIGGSHGPPPWSRCSFASVWRHHITTPIATSKTIKLLVHNESKEYSLSKQIIYMHHGESQGDSSKWSLTCKSSNKPRLRSPIFIPHNYHHQWATQIDKLGTYF